MGELVGIAKFLLMPTNRILMWVFHSTLGCVLQNKQIQKPISFSIDKFEIVNSFTIDQSLDAAPLA